MRKMARTNTRQTVLSLLLCSVSAVALMVLLTAGNERGAQAADGQTVPEPSRPQVVAHRAGAALAPENTLEALARSIAAGADTAEIDVRRTVDGVLVAVHDDDLARTTGVNRAVRQTTYEELRRLDAGSWYGESFAGARIPTLEAMLAAARGNIRLMVELKCAADERGVEEETIRMIRAMGMEGACALACTSTDLLRRCKELAPEMDTVYIGETLPLEVYKLRYVDSCSIQLAGLSEAEVARARAVGKPIYAWTVNTAEELGRARALGVDGLVTDNPELGGLEEETG